MKVKSLEDEINKASSNLGWTSLICPNALKKSFSLHFDSLLDFVTLYLATGREESWIVLEKEYDKVKWFRLKSLQRALNIFSGKMKWVGKGNKYKRRIFESFSDEPFF